jgi:CRP-like cAMP-binding protein
MHSHFASALPVATTQPSMTGRVVEYLCHHRIFGVLPRAAAQEIAPEIIERNYRKGHYFFRLGDPPSYLFALTSGLATLTEPDPGGRAHLLQTFSPGDVFGLATGVLGIYRTTSAAALTDADALLIRRELFEDLRHRFPALAHQVTVELARMLCRSEETTVRLTLSSVTSRLAKLLLDVSSATGADHHCMSHSDLALLVGASRETITRTLGRLRRAGILAADGHQLTILERSTLRRISGAERRRPTKLSARQSERARPAHS